MKVNLPQPAEKRGARNRSNQNVMAVATGKAVTVDTPAGSGSLWHPATKLIRKGHRIV
jgi:hypothetical protein